MRIFVSSVRLGLEEERDSLRGLILALGHEPVMFEDFSAQPVPSRQACLDAVRGCDAYLLLLGPRYGHPFEETGLSPTEEEHVAARVAGIPRLAMRKSGVDPEPQQQQLIDEVRSYNTGLFYSEFTNAVDLQAKVAAAVRTLAAAPGALAWQPLASPVVVDWRWDWPDQHQGRTDRAVLEVHVVPVPPMPVPSRLLRSLPDRLATEIRTIGGVGSSAPVPADVDTVAAWARIGEQDRNRAFREPTPGSLLGCRVASTGQISAWASLPGDSMGGILDPADLTERLALLLRTAGAVLPGDVAHVAMAVGLSPLSGVTEGTVSGVSRNSASGFYSGGDRLAVPPDETVTKAAVAHGSRDAAQTLAQALLLAFRDSGRSGWR